MTERSSKAGAGGTAAKDEKSRRLAEALRENLRRRKAQSRARTRAERAASDDEGTRGGAGD